MTESISAFLILFIIFFFFGIGAGIGLWIKRTHQRTVVNGLIEDEVNTSKVIDDLADQLAEDFIETWVKRVRKETNKRGLTTQDCNSEQCCHGHPRTEENGWIRPDRTVGCKDCMSNGQRCNHA